MLLVSLGILFLNLLSLCTTLPASMMYVNCQLQLYTREHDFCNNTFWNLMYFVLLPGTFLMNWKKGRWSEPLGFVSAVLFGHRVKELRCIVCGDRYLVKFRQAGSLFDQTRLGCPKMGISMIHGSFKRSLTFLLSLLISLLPLLSFLNMTMLKIIINASRRLQKLLA